MTALSTDIGAHDASVNAPAPSASADVFGILPGLALTAGIAAMAFALRQLPYVSVLSPIILSIAIGMIFHNFIGTPSFARPGVAFSMRRILRFAIVLLGLQLTASQLVEVGARGIAVIALTLIATFLFTVQLGRLIGVDRKLSELIAAGTSICGASAVIATNTVTRAPDEDVAYAVACVTIFGSIAMFVYPLFPGLLHLDPHAFGLWSGASIHEIAQVVAAAFQDGRDAGEFGTIAGAGRHVARVIGNQTSPPHRRRPTERARATAVVRARLHRIGWRQQHDFDSGRGTQRDDSADHVPAVHGTRGHGTRDRPPQTLRKGNASAAARRRCVPLHFLFQPRADQNPVVTEMA
jgi:hypothetical protein